MYRHFNNQFEREITTIHPGEFLASDDDILISTVLGSCVAVAIHDRRRRIGGLNHFLLPQALPDSEAFYATMSGKYGMYAMELLINDMLKLGARKQDMEAKVFGGSSVLAGSGDYRGKISESNIEFAFTYLKTEGIPVTGNDVGGPIARKIFYYPFSNRVLVKKLSGNLISTIAKEENAYMKRLRDSTKDGGEPTLF